VNKKTTRIDSARIAGVLHFFRILFYQGIKQKQTVDDNATEIGSDPNFLEKLLIYNDCLELTKSTPTLEMNVILSNSPQNQFGFLFKNILKHHNKSSDSSHFLTTVIHFAGVPSS
tara:strand:+ start:38985 stop:39329 length:345 start_codon:yes stop_codon:yes gene_type:complete